MTSRRELSRAILPRGGRNGRHTCSDDWTTSSPRYFRPLSLVLLCSLAALGTAQLQHTGRSPALPRSSQSKFGSCYSVGAQLQGVPRTLLHMCCFCCMSLRVMPCPKPIYAYTCHVPSCLVGMQFDLLHGSLFFIAESEPTTACLQEKLLGNLTIQFPTSLFLPASLTMPCFRILASWYVQDL